MARTTSFFPPGDDESLGHFPAVLLNCIIFVELINRLDSIQTFNRLNHKSILAIVSLRLGDVTERLKDRRITLDIDQTAREWLAKHGYSNEYGMHPTYQLDCTICLYISYEGARAIARIVRNTVLSPLAKKLLAGTIRFLFLCHIIFISHTLMYSTRRDGDVVSVRVSEDSTTLDVKDNHLSENAETLPTPGSHPIAPAEDVHY
jgi:ATP-dependent Clp protease ATP-binding subunit ClpB